MSRTTKHILITLVGVNILAVAVLIFLNIKYLYAFEVAFISSSLVIFSSLKSYRNMVEARVEHGVITLDDSKDVIDKLEDPYDLYSEDVMEEDVVEVVKQERKKSKDNRSLFQILKDTKAALSFYRLGAYLVLILGFLYLNRHGLLHIPSYIIALGLPPFLIVTVLLSEQHDN